MTFPLIPHHDACLEAPYQHAYAAEARAEAAEAALLAMTVEEAKGEPHLADVIIDALIAQEEIQTVGQLFDLLRAAGLAAQAKAVITANANYWHNIPTDREEF